MAGDFYDRSKEIELGQAKNQALEIIKLEYTDDADCKKFLEQHKDMYFELVEMLLQWNTELNNKFIKKAQPIPASAPTPSKKEFPEKECPRCKKMIPAYFKQHFECSWKQDE